MKKMNEITLYYIHSAEAFCMNVREIVSMLIGLMIIGIWGWRDYKANKNSDNNNF